jgi:hypothetical protein
MNLASLRSYNGSEREDRCYEPLRQILLHWPEMESLQWVNCEVDDPGNGWEVARFLGKTQLDDYTARRTFRFGHPDEELESCVRLNEAERRESEYIFKFSALKVARIARGFSAGFTRFYRAVRPLGQEHIQRSIVITKGSIESLTGFELDAMHRIRHVSSPTQMLDILLTERQVAELEIDVDGVQVKEITGSREGHCY